MKAPGNTPCIRLPEWESTLGLDGIWVKDESANPTGTYKDRRSAAIVQQATKQLVDKLVLISAGNAAYSLAKYAEDSGIEVHAVIDRNLTAGIKSVLQRVCKQVIEVELGAKLLQSDELIAMVRTSPGELIWNVSNGFHDAYKQIVLELQRDLPHQPDSIAMPFGGGEAMVGVALGVADARWQDRTTVVGFHNNQSERLKTSAFCKAYVTYLRADKMPCTPVIDMTTSEPLDGVQRNYVPAGLRVEEAGSNTFQAVRVFAHNDRQENKVGNHFGKNIVIVNSGYGKVLEEAGMANT